MLGGESDMTPPVGITLTLNDHMSKNSEESSHEVPGGGGRVRCLGRRREFSPGLGM